MRRVLVFCIIFCSLVAHGATTNPPPFLRSFLTTNYSQGPVTNFQTIIFSNNFWVARNTNVFGGSGGGAFGQNGDVQVARNGTNFALTNFNSNVDGDGITIWNLPVGLLGSSVLSTPAGGGILSRGSFQHTNGAFAGGIFVSDATGIARWTTNLPGVVVTNISGPGLTNAILAELLWTNTANEYLPTRTNSFGFAKEGGGLWLGKNATNYWGHLLVEDSIIAFREGNQNFRFIALPGGGVTNIISGALAAGQATFLVDARDDPLTFGSILLNAEPAGLAYITLTSNNTITAKIANNGDSWLNGGGAQLGIGTALPATELHVAGEIFTSGGITNNGTYQHTVGAFTGALFVSSNANGVAYWTTNVNNIGVTNLSVYNNVIFNGSIISNFNSDLNWTNDGVVLKGSLKGINPKSAMRFGGVSGTQWDNTNVGRHTFGFGTNVTAIPIGAVVFGEGNSIGTNANWSTIAGGVQNSISSNFVTSFIGGGGLNVITGLGAYRSTITGGSNNQINIPNASDLGGAFIGGGGDNVVRSNYVVLAGGFGNQANSDYTFLGGGLNNIVSSGSGNSKASAVVAGEQNTANGVHVFVGGGRQNKAGGNSTTLADFGFIGGGANNLIGTIGAGTSIYSVINGGRSNEVRGVADYCVINGGWANLTDQNTNTVIGGGYKNIVTSAHLGQILGGVLNLVNSSGSFGYIVGNSNQVNANGAGVIGTRGTNTLVRSLELAPNGNTVRLTTSNTLVRTSFATEPDTVVTLTADNQVVDATLRTHIRLASDSATANQRTFVLTGTNVTSGAHAILEWTGTNAGELVDDSANSGAGNIRLSATWTPTQYDTLSLIFNGTDWIETARATN